MLNRGSQQEAPAPSEPPKGKARVDAKWKGEDQFLPSEQTGAGEDTARAAGIFSVKGKSLFSQAAQFFLEQGAPTEGAKGKERAFAAAAGAEASEANEATRDE